LLREMVPRIARIAFLFNMSHPVLQAQWKEAEPAARSVGLEPQLLDVRTGRDLEPAFDAAVRQRTGAVIVGIDALTQANRGQIVEALAKRHLPAISREREFVDAGGLISYGIHYSDSYRRAAVYVMVEALGLTIPESVLLRADQVIQ
jgi:putative ABC transport system substrate-binding protein